jgi:phosphohistidine phosphatase
MDNTELYLIRHGIAADRGTYANDEQRPLTDGGQRKTAQVAKRLRELGLTFDLILTSPLVRAYQTAEIFRDAGLSQHLEISQLLAPAGKFGDWLSWLAQWRQQGGTKLAIVGHQPDLGHWAEQLTWGECCDQLVLKKAGIIGLALPAPPTDPSGHGQLFWLTAPKLLL